MSQPDPKSLNPDLPTRVSDPAADLLVDAGLTDLRNHDLSFLDSWTDSQLQARRIELTSKAKSGNAMDALSDLELHELCGIHTRLRLKNSGPPTRAKATKAPPSAADLTDIPDF